MDPRLFDNILKAFTEIWRSNLSTLTNEALGLLGGLATIALIIMAVGWYAADGHGFFPDVIFTVAQYTLLVVFVTNLHEIIDMLVESFVWFGFQASGSQAYAGSFKMPSLIFDAGQQLSEPYVFYLANMQGWFSTMINLVNLLVFGVCLFFIAGSFWLMCIHIMCAVIELQMLAIISLLLIPWAAVGPTSFIAAGAFGRLISAIVYLGMLALVTGVTIPVFVMLATSDKVPTWQIGFLTSFGALTLAVLNFKVPAMAGRNTFTAQGFAQVGAAITYGITRAVRMI